MESSTRGRRLKRPRMPDEDVSYATQASGKQAQVATGAHRTGDKNENEETIRHAAQVRYSLLMESPRLTVSLGLVE